MCSFFHIIKKKKKIYSSGFIIESYCTKILKEQLLLVKEGKETINPVPQLPFICGTIVFLHVILFLLFFFFLWYS